MDEHLHVPYVGSPVHKSRPECFFCRLEAPEICAVFESGRTALLEHGCQNRHMEELSPQHNLT